MVAFSALSAALVAAKRPSMVQVLTREPLPAGVLTLIRVAAGCRETLDLSIDRTGKDAEFIERAAVFYLEHVLWGPGSDHYRVLGVGSHASTQQIAEHARWLMRWATDKSLERRLPVAKAMRIVEAWDVLKQSALRRQYDQELASVTRSSLERNQVELIWREGDIDWNALPSRATPIKKALRSWQAIGAAAVILGSSAVVFAASAPRLLPLLGDFAQPAAGNTSTQSLVDLTSVARGIAQRHPGK